jgi:hypothetical protein
MRSTAASVAVALIAAMLTFAGGGTALAATAGSPVASAKEPQASGNQMMASASPGDSCGGASVALAIGTASRSGVTEVLEASAHSTGMRSALPMPTCTCVKSATPTTLTTTCTCSSTRTHSISTMVVSRSRDGVARSRHRRDTRKSRTKKPGHAHVVLRTASEMKSGSILPVTGTDMGPLAAGTSICLLAGSVALVAGRTGHLARVTKAVSKLRRRLGSGR